MKRLLLLCGHRLHLRNLVSSGLAERLTTDGWRITVVAPERDWWDLPPPLRDNLAFFSLDKMAEAGWRGRLRRFLMLGTMVAREPASVTMAYKLRHEGRSRVKVGVWRAIRRLTDPLALARRIEALVPISVPAKGLLAVVRPDLCLWPSTFAQTGEYDLIGACRAAGVPILAMPASWDTISSKPSALVLPDALLVWGPASAAQALEQGYRKVTITGPAHWDCYQERILPSAGKTVLVVGTSVHYWQDEQQIVAALAREATHDGGIWRILYRPHPSRLKDSPSESFGSLVELDSRLGYDLAPGFQEHIRDRLLESACVVAAWSTLIVEAALCGRPSIVPAFAQSAHGIGGVIAHRHLDHMREVVSWPGVFVCRTLPGLIGMVRKAVAGTLDYDPADLRRRALMVALADGHAQDRIVQTLHNFP